MPIREFTDLTGTRWRVWSTLLTASAALGVKSESWLTFDSGASRRRLSPIPSGWEDATDEELSLLCEHARAVLVTPTGAGPLRTIG